MLGAEHPIEEPEIDVDQNEQYELDKIVANALKMNMEESVPKSTFYNRELKMRKEKSVSYEDEPEPFSVASVEALPTPVINSLTKHGILQV